MIMKKIQKYYKGYSELNIILFIVFNVILLILINLSIRFLPFMGSLKNTVVKDMFEGHSIYYAFFMTNILIPLLETLIFQTLVIKGVFFLLKKKNTIKVITAITISAILFSINHLFSLLYLLLTFFIGLVLANVYIIMVKRRHYPTLITFLIHALYNTTLFFYGILIND